MKRNRCYVITLRSVGLVSFAVVLLLGCERPQPKPKTVSNTPPTNNAPSLKNLHGPGSLTVVEDDTYSKTNAARVVHALVGEELANDIACPINEWLSISVGSGMKVDGVIDSKWIEDSQFVDATRYELDSNFMKTISSLKRMEYLRMPASSTSDQIEWATQFVGLRGLTLRGAKISNENFRGLSRLKNLEWLSLDEVDATDNEPPMPRLPNLKWLSLNSASGLDNWRSFSAYPHLKSLGLDHSTFNDEDIVTLSKSHPNLLVLRLYYCRNFSDPESFSGFKNLKRLEVALTKVARNNRMFSILPDGCYLSRND